MLYDNPKNILQQKINETLSEPQETMLSDLIKLSLLKKASVNSDLLIYEELYKLLGLQKFTELIDLVDGRKIEFPTKEDFREAVITCLCYYYREVEHKDWNEIKTLVGDMDLNTVKEGIRVSQFDSFLRKAINKNMKKPR